MIKTVSFAGAIIALLIVSSIFFGSFSMMNTPDGSAHAAQAEQTCPSLAESLTATTVYPKQPTNLPNGYKLACTHTDATHVQLVYWDKPVQSPDLSDEKLVSQGAIVVKVSLMNNQTDPAYRIKDRSAELNSIYKEFGPQLHPRLTKIMNNLAVVREQCNSCGIAEAIFPDGRHIVKNFPMPTMIIFYDGDLLYILQGNFPSSGLEAIANSMK
jgi:hypothetical protein